MKASKHSAKQRWLVPTVPWILRLAGLALVLSGCATPVGVRHVDIQTAYRIHTESALSAEQPSEPSKMVLRRLGLLDRFGAEPAAVLAELHRGLNPSGDDDRLFALAELSFLHADRTNDRAYFLASAVYAWALLFPDDAAGTPLQPWDPRFRLAYDLYNQAVAKGLAAHGKGVDKNEVRLTPGVYKLPFGTLAVSLDETGLTWGGYRLDRFIPTTTLEVRGLRNRYRTPGLGAPLAASLAERQASAKVVGSERLGPRTKVPVTALLRFEHARASLGEGRIRGRIEVYAADQTSTVQVNGRDQPLESDPTAALAYQLEGSPIYAAEIQGFLRGGAFRGLMPRDRAQDGLAMMQPYRSGKIPVVLVHGTASSPARWAELFNELQGDPRIRERFHIWLFLYDTGNPIAYSAGQLRAALTAAVKEFDPEGKDPALRDMVVIGHSQGGLLTKLAAIDSGSRFWDRVSSKPFDSIQVDPKTRELLRQTAFYTPLPFVGRVVFVATPHHGALLASGRIGAIAAWLVTLPVGVFSQVAQAATLTGDEKLIALLRRPPTAVDNMNPENPGLQVLQTIRVDPRIPAHSIICVKGDGPKEAGDDGVVAYRSAHIDEAVTEKVVRSDHSCQGKPEVIEDIRRILLEHAAAFEGRRP
ncbi:alpha/beta fold hydrolase [Methylocaldum sp. RMAD-M]|jgi:pimeloyl-ACP methyl ester carboxylesterase|uniref:alpha/beta fold hydrolase n=1 Tax=Methylocaldum sp. RMAD-M TaxID=2806557 RepID=UPI000A3258DC|nr:alpha/beta fold hydrolase [Methylocaldum sp. RMAD-M]